MAENHFKVYQETVRLVVYINHENKPIMVCCRLDVSNELDYESAFVQE